MLRIPTTQWQRQPWKNGGGVTHEIWRDPAPTDTPDTSAFAVRVSCAEVASDGPFSAFPGVDRTILLLEGAGFSLRRSDGARADVHTISAPFAFSGDEAWTCTLVAGPVRDLNIMTSRDHARAAVRVVSLAAEPQLTLARLVVIVALDAGVEVTAGREVATLARWETVITGGEVTLRAPARQGARAAVALIEDAHQRRVASNYTMAVVDLANPVTEPTWVVTAYNPGGTLREPHANAAAHARLQLALSAAGIRHTPAVGRNPEDTWREPSFALTGCGRAAALALAEAFDQDAIFELEPGAPTPCIVWCRRATERT